MPAKLTYAIGDIHGSYRKLVDLLRHCRKHCGTADRRLIFLGDYIDRGDNSREVVEFLIEIQLRAPERIICLRGNHEELLIDAAKGENIPRWLINGGDATLRSYDAMLPDEIPDDHLKWFATLPLTTSDEKRFFVHAGVMPGVPLEQQSKEAMLWIRERFLSDPRDHGLYVVHGHTPIESGAPELRRNRLNLDTGACFGGPLTAAVFDDTTVGPIAFITDDGMVWPAPALTALPPA